MGWGDNPQPTGQVPSLPLGDGSVPSGHGTACQSRELRQLPAQDTRGSPPPLLQEQEGAPGRARMSRPQQDAGWCAGLAVPGESACVNLGVSPAGISPCPHPLPPGVCGAGPAWVWHGERLQRREPRAAQPTPELPRRSRGCRGAPPLLLLLLGTFTATGHPWGIWIPHPWKCNLG